MRILIVTPDSELRTNIELVAAATNNRPTILDRRVNTREVLGHIQSGEYEAIHFGAHGNEEALMMSDGPLHEADLEQAFDIAFRKGSPVRIVLLNACRSISTAARLHTMGVAGPGYVIGWRDEVEDEAASAFAAHFWRNIRPSGPVHEVFEAAAEVMRSEFPDQEDPILINGVKAQLIEVNRRLKEIQHNTKPFNRLDIFIAAGFAILIAMMALLLAIQVFS